ncbi:hypothetical protein SDC9_95930 [bioreactor metagenome]|uniref:Uncharacterized protein n=1 Tax=bioreactor metagenome TaxID=1076179 RepID=A0A645A7V9_9ZZZZ
MHRLLHALLRRALADLAAAIVLSKSNHRPAIVTPRAHQIEFIAALRAVLDYPEASVRRHRGGLHVAVPPTPYFGKRTGAACQRVVGRHLTIRLHAHHLAQVVVQRLRLLLLIEALAQPQIQRALPVLGDAAAKMQTTVDLGFLAEQRFHIGQRLRARRIGCAGKRRRIQGVGSAIRLGIAKVQPPVAGEILVQHHIQQTALAASGNLGQARQGCAHAPRGIHHTHAAKALGHQIATFGQKRHGPWMLQALRQHLHLQRTR